MHIPKFYLQPAVCTFVWAGLRLLAETKQREIKKKWKEWKKIFWIFPKIGEEATCNDKRATTLHRHTKWVRCCCSMTTEEGMFHVAQNSSRRPRAASPWFWLSRPTIYGSFLLNFRLSLCFSLSLCKLCVMAKKVNVSLSLLREIISHGRQSCLWLSCWLVCWAQQTTTDELENKGNSFKKHVGMWAFKLALFVEVRVSAMREIERDCTFHLAANSKTLLLDSWFWCLSGDCRRCSVDAGQLPSMGSATFADNSSLGREVN